MHRELRNLLAFVLGWCAGLATSGSRKAGFTKVSLTDEELSQWLVATALEGQLMSWLTAPDRSEQERTAAITCLAVLHRKKTIDVLAHIGRPATEQDSRLDYDVWSCVYRELIPLLDDDALRVASAVGSLAVGRWEWPVHDAFLAWCSQSTKRVDDVLALESNPEVADFCFTAALVAALKADVASYLSVAVQYVRGARRSRLPGIRAIGGMPVHDDAIMQLAVAELGSVLDDAEANASDRADALRAALDVAYRSGGSLDKLVSQMVEKAVVSGQSESLLVCCNMVFRFAEPRPSDILPQLLLALRAMGIDAADTRSSIGSALYALFSRGRTGEALECLEILLRQSKSPEPLSLLTSISHYLTHDGVNRLGDTICRWLLTGDKVLCGAAFRLVATTGDQKFVFDFDPGNSGWPDGLTVDIARKAIGWLMPHGTAPASFVVCLLRHASKPAIKALGELLFDPLLVNYPLAARAYLEAVCPSLPPDAKACVQDVLSRDDEYKRGIEGVGFLPEFEPSERQRAIEHRRQNDDFARSSREAAEKSIFALISTRQTMLYGNRAIDYVEMPDGGPRRLENRLGIVTVTADNAMEWVYDPCGLDLKIRVLRAERKPE